MTNPITCAQAGFSTDKTPEELFLWRRSKEYAELFGIKGDKESDYTHVAQISLIVAGLLILAAVAIFPIVRATTAPNWIAFWEVLQILGVGGAVMSALGCIAKYLSARKSFADRVKVLKGASVTEELSNLGDNPTMAQLYRLNRKQLDEYHELSVQQQRIAFTAAQAATFSAFTILILGALYSVTSSEAGQDFKSYISAGLTALGTLLSGFLAKTFYDSYRRTTQQLALYYREPYKTNLLLGMERIAKCAPLSGNEEAKLTERRVWENMLTHLSQDYSYESKLLARSLSPAWVLDDHDEANSSGKAPADGGNQKRPKHDGSSKKGSGAKGSSQTSPTTQAETSNNNQ